MSNFLDKLKTSLEPNESISAFQAYMLAKYQKVYTVDELFKSLVTNIWTGIKAKAGIGHYSYITELDEELLKYLPKIQETFQSLGFTVILLDNNTTINNSKLKNIKNQFIIFIWDSISIDPFVDEKSNDTK